MAKTRQIGVIPGDGTGPEVIAEGLKILEAVAEKTGMVMTRVCCLCVRHFRV